MCKSDRQKGTPYVKIVPTRVKQVKADHTSNGQMHMSTLSKQL